MHRRKGAYSSGAPANSRKKHAGHGSASSQKKHGSGAAHAVSHKKRSGGGGAAAGNGEAHRSYFPTDAHAAAERAAGRQAGAQTPVTMRSRAASISGPASAGSDPFAGVRLRADSAEPHLQQANLVLAAIGDLLRERGLDATGMGAGAAPTPTHYFGVLMVLLEQRAQHSAEQLGACVYLLSLLLPQLPPAVLKSKMEATAALLIAVLQAHAEDAHIAKHVLECAAAVLSATALDAPAVWAGTTSSAPSVAQLMQVLLVYSLDHRPRIRRAAQDGVKDTLRGMHEAGLARAAAAPTAAAAFAPARGVPRSVSDTLCAFALREMSSCTPKDCQLVLFLCGLLQSCIHFLSLQAAAKILEALLSMVGKGNSILFVQSMRTLDAFFSAGGELHLKGAATSRNAADSSSPEARAREKFLQLSSQLLTVLLSLKPHQNDNLASAAYLHTLQVALVRFLTGLENAPSSSSSLSASFASTLAQSYDRIPSLLGLIAEGLLSPKEEVVRNSAKAMGEIMRKTLTRSMVTQSIAEGEHAASRSSGAGAGAKSTQALPPFYRVVELMENLLGYRYKAQWNRILLLVGELFHAVAPGPGAEGEKDMLDSASPVQKAQNLLVPLLRKLDSLHTESSMEEAPENPNLDYRPALDEALGAAIAALGPEKILSVLPLNLPLDYYSAPAPAASSKSKKGSAPAADEQEQQPLHELLSASRSWLFPLFRSYVSRARLGFFHDFLLVLALQIHQLEKSALARTRPLEARAFQGLKIAVWDLFPSWCSSSPRDVAQAFKPLISHLGKNYLSGEQMDEMGWTHGPICKGVGAIVRKLKEAAEVGQTSAAGSKTASASAATKAAGHDDEDDEANPALDDDDDDEDDDEDEDDSDDDDVLAKAAAKRKAAAARRAIAQSVATASKAAPASSSSTATPVASSSSASSKRAPAWSPSEAAHLLATVMSPLAERLLRALFSLATMPREIVKLNNREVIFDAIALWASVAPGEVLEKEFMGVLGKLMAHIVAVRAKKSSAADAAASGAGGAAASGEAGSMDESPNTPANGGPTAAEIQRTHLLMDIVLAICTQSLPSLGERCTQRLYEVLAGQLAAEPEDVEPALQKKVYKVLSLLFDQSPTYLDANFETVVQALQQSAGSLHASALKSRLACVRCILIRLPERMLVDKSALGILPGFLGEIILGAKEVAHKTRDYAFGVLIELGRTMLRVQDARRASSGGATDAVLFGALSQPESSNPLMSEYVYMVAAGLAGSSNHMQAASVLCLARMLYEFRTELGEELISSILTTVLPLFETKSRELVKALLTFLKVAILSFDGQSLLQHLPSIVGGLVLWCTEKKQRFKLKIKVLFEILMRKVGVDPVRELVPPEQTALVEHIRKSKEREKRIKAEQWKASRKDKDDDMQDVSTSHKPLQDYDSIMRDDELAAEDAGDSSASRARAGTTGKVAKSGGAKSGKDVAPLWIRQSNVDFLDPSVVGKVTATNPRDSGADSANAAASSSRRGHVQLGHGVSQDASSGKLVVAGGKGSASALTGAAASAMLDVEELSQELKGRAREKRKRQAEAEDEAAAEADDDEAKRVVKKQQLPGAQFRSTKAGGDMQRRGQMSPYAFVPLEPSALNKRKKLTSQRRLESIVTAAKKGSAAGSHIAKRSHKKTNKGHKKHGQ